jgi:hypothetical protein
MTRWSRGSGWCQGECENEWGGAGVHGPHGRPIHGKVFHVHTARELEKVMHALPSLRQHHVSAVPGTPDAVYSPHHCWNLCVMCDLWLQVWGLWRQVLLRLMLQLQRFSQPNDRWSFAQKQEEEQ